MEKWSYKGHEEFAEYFDQSYLKRTNKWAECFSKTCPSTNNGIESTNAVIKEQKTLRARLPTNIFLQKMLEIAISWSKRRDEESINVIQFLNVPRIELPIWTEGFHLAINPNEIFVCKVFFLPDQLNYHRKMGNILYPIMLKIVTNLIS